MSTPTAAKGAAAEGWYLDPLDETGKRQRYWDGTRWTEEVSRLPYGHLPHRGPVESRKWAVAAHVSSLVPFVPFVGPLLVFLLRRDNDPFAREHAAEATNFAVTILLAYVVVMFVIGFVFLGVLGLDVVFVAPFLAAVWLFQLVLVLRAARKGSAGDYFAYPATAHFFT